LNKITSKPQQHSIKQTQKFFKTYHALSILKSFGDFAILGDRAQGYTQLLTIQPTVQLKNCSLRFGLATKPLAYEHVAVCLSKQANTMTYYGKGISNQDFDYYPGSLPTELRRRCHLLLPV